MNQHNELYEREKEEVWIEPVQIVAKRYGISDVALAKTCRRLAVPLPPRGYWASIRGGGKPPRPPLAPYESLPKSKTRSPVPKRSVGTTDSRANDEKGRQGFTMTAITIPETSESSIITEKEPDENKRNTRKTSGREFPEYLYCTVDGWQRTFSFGVNRMQPIKGLIEKDGGYDEWDHLQVFATVRYHSRPRKGRKRTGQCVELWVRPTHVPRTDWRNDPKGIGSVWAEKGRLFGSIFAPADAFYSFFPCLASNHFKEAESSPIK